MKLLPLVAIVSAFLIGLASAPKPTTEVPPAPSVESFPEYQAKVAECNSLSFALNQAREAAGLAEGKLAEFQAKGPTIIREPADTTELESLRVRLAEAEKLRLAFVGYSETCDCSKCEEVRKLTGLQKKSNQCETVIPQGRIIYGPRPRLFGRFR